MVTAEAVPNSSTGRPVATSAATDWRGGVAGMNWYVDFDDYTAKIAKAPKNEIKEGCL
jgi:hypothetical protein